MFRNSAGDNYVAEPVSRLGTANETAAAFPLTDLYISTLRRFVEAAGGTLELRVERPGKGVLPLTGMGELAP